MFEIFTIKIKARLRNQIKAIINKMHSCLFSQMAVFTHLRLACNFASYETRVLCVQARLQALSVLVYCNALQVRQISIYPLHCPSHKATTF